MGLDCYIVHGNDRDKPFTHEDDERIKDVRLCGGLFSGGGSDGSFRGKVYDPIIRQLSEGKHTWYLDDHDDFIPSDVLKEQADLLAELIQAEVDLADEEGRVIGDDDIILTISDEYAYYHNEEFTYKEIDNLMTLLRVAAERKAVMTVWW